MDEGPLHEQASMEKMEGVLRAAWRLRDALNCSAAEIVAKLRRRDLDAGPTFKPTSRTQIPLWQ